ncbi:hypothetical protein EW026_g1602 [Hermanssonia centrifuga]|uniref:DUF6533 domain-containing protein n=1 Tax=Hermanssonia centrifuga TaxID=98765 RepID=A0A4S4KQY1_9APHY|nr:hypothetical protein EW026_g1602 [Hermanssonia centrifuga]
MAVASLSDVANIADKRALNTAAVGALSWLIWDTIIHFDVEVACIWQRPKLRVKMTYAFIRYGTIFQAGAVATLAGSARFSNTGCRDWIIEELVYMEALTLVVEVILVMRLYVLYNQNKTILLAMVTLFAAEIAMMIAVLVFVLPRMTFGPDCLVAGAPSFFMAYWLSSLAFETFLFVLTLVAFFQSVRREWGRQSILFVFVRDGTWAFVIIFICLLLNTLMYRLNTNPLAGMGYFGYLGLTPAQPRTIPLSPSHMAGPSAQDVDFTTDKMAVNMAAGAALSWLVWDTVVHFDVEVECIWRRPRLWVKMVYTFIRYVTIFHAGTWIIEELVYMEVLTVVVEIILVMRLYVLFNQNKFILGAMITLFIGEIAMMITVLAIVLPKMSFGTDCLVAAAPSFFMAYW